MPNISSIYRPRNPQNSGYYRCVEDHFEIISVIEDEEVIKRILKHLGLWDVKPRPPPGTRVDAEKTETIIDDSFSQLPASDKWLHVDPEYPEIFPA